MDLNAEIAKVAYELYVRDGRQHGKDREHWLEAEKIVRARHASGERMTETAKKADPPQPKKTASPKAPAAKGKQAASKTAPAKKGAR